jgi:hypothetical protein
MVENQTTDTVLMISPDTFTFNEQTAATNAFQQGTVVTEGATAKALQEFNEMVASLRQHAIRVIVLNSRCDVVTPDAVFPNNWFTSHKTEQGEVIILYPMQAENRRIERQVDALKQALVAENIHPTKFIDLTHYEKQNKFFEGTGSAILDRVNHIAYAAISPRTDVTVLNDFAKQMNYTPVTFHSYDRSGALIYHTNVVMSVGTGFVVLAADTITDSEERKQVLASCEKSNKHVIAISSAQMEKMAGNILEVKSTDGKAKIVMSQTAAQSFTAAQRETLANFGELVIVNIDTIEKLGGGSSRCMLAEIF